MTNPVIECLGLVVTGIQLVSSSHGGYNWNNSILVTLDADASNVGPTQVEHWYMDRGDEPILPDGFDCPTWAVDSNPQLIEKKMVGPINYFAIFHFDDDGNLIESGGSYGSKYLGLSRGGGAGRRSVYNQYGFGVSEILLIGNGVRTCAYMEDELLKLLAAHFGVDIDLDEVYEHSVFSGKQLGTEIDPQEIFANHSGI